MATKRKIARSKRRTKPTAENSEIRRAVERTGLPTMLSPEGDPATALAFLKDRIVAATDLVAESLASIEEQKDREEFYPDSISSNLKEVLLALFQVRWECYQTGGNVKAAQGGAS